jgi:flavin reductase (DIM6/NTAB) family NADH-FMN oxidoreductase RutF
VDPLSATFDQGEFRTVLGHFASGVVLVTGMHSGHPSGFTCQSFFSLSLDPPLVALAPGKASTSWPRVSSTGSFCINVLASNQEALARTFSLTGADKFAGVGWSPAVSGAPRLHGAGSWTSKATRASRFCSIGAVMAGSCPEGLTVV